MMPVIVPPMMLNACRLRLVKKKKKGEEAEAGGWKTRERVRAC